MCIGAIGGHCMELELELLYLTLGGGVTRSLVTDATLAKIEQENVYAMNSREIR